MKEQLKLQPKLKPNQFFIINLDNSDGHGTHWTALLMKDNNNAFYYDSYGLVSGHEVNSYADKYKLNLYYNTKREQTKHNTCGIHTIDFIIKNI